MDKFNMEGCKANGTCAWQSDQSYIGNIPGSHDFFMCHACHDVCQTSIDAC